MRASGERHHKVWAKVVSILIIAATVTLGFYVLDRWKVAPSSGDATIDSDVVHVGAVVGGRIIDIPVAENSRVERGDILFQIDPVPYELAVRQARSELDIARAALETQHRFISTQSSSATVAGDQVRRATINLDLATRTVARLKPLAGKGYVPQQQLDQAETAARDAATSLQQAREQEAAAIRAVDSAAGAEATVRAREAALAIAMRSLEDTTVRATHAGHVTGLTVMSGEIVAPSQALFTLVSDEEWFAVANFREIELGAIKIGGCVTAYSMIDRRQAIRGVVQGIGAGVLDTDRVNLPRSVPYVERSLNWVRVSQRFPVRVLLHDPPARLMRLGASAVVEVNHGAACP